MNGKLIWACWKLIDSQHTHTTQTAHSATHQKRICVFAPSHCNGYLFCEHMCFLALVRALEHIYCLCLWYNYVIQWGAKLHIDRTENGKVLASAATPRAYTRKKSRWCSSKIWSKTIFDYKQKAIKLKTVYIFAYSLRRNSANTNKMNK